MLCVVCLLFCRELKWKWNHISRLLTVKLQKDDYNNICALDDVDINDYSMFYAQAYSIHIFSSATTSTCLVDWVLILLKLKFFFVGWLVARLVVDWLGLDETDSPTNWICFLCSPIPHHKVDVVVVFVVVVDRSTKIKQQVQVMVMTTAAAGMQAGRQAASSYSRQLLL